VDSSQNVKDLEAFVRNQEELNFALDLGQRVQRLSRTFDMLCELTDQSWDGQKNKDQRVETVHVFTEAEEQSRLRVRIESELLTHFMYYELKSVTDMLRVWRIEVVTGTELEYALKVRDRLLAHPELFRLAPSPFGGASYPEGGGFMKVQIGTPFPTDPFHAAYYKSKLGLGLNGDVVAEAARNESIIRSKAKNKKLREDEVNRIKVFGVREPDLVDALTDFANLLSASMSHIKRVVDVALVENGYERYEVAGPLQAHRLL
jgi:hypothetical protein